jgi:hypothetical protein
MMGADRIPIASVPIQEGHDKESSSFKKLIVIHLPVLLALSSKA